MQNMADVLHQIFVRVTMVGPVKDVLNVFPYPVASTELAKKRHFNAYAMTQIDGLEHFVINVINFCSLRSESPLNTQYETHKIFYDTIRMLYLQPFVKMAVYTVVAQNLVNVCKYNIIIILYYKRFWNCLKLR